MWQALRSLATAEHARILKQEVTSVNLSRMCQASLLLLRKPRLCDTTTTTTTIHKTDLSKLISHQIYLLQRTSLQLASLITTTDSVFSDLSRARLWVVCCSCNPRFLHFVGLPVALNYGGNCCCLHKQGSSQNNHELGTKKKEREIYFQNSFDPSLQLILKSIGFSSSSSEKTTYK